MEQTKDIQLIIKNLGRSEDFKLKIPLDATVLDLKQKLENEYPGQPAVGSQRIIFAGRELKDLNTNLETLFKSTLNFCGDLSQPQTLHLVIPSKSATQSPPVPPASVATNNLPPFSPQQQFQQPIGQPQIPPHILQQIRQNMQNMQNMHIPANLLQFPQQFPVVVQPIVPPRPQQRYIDWMLLIKLAAVIYILAQGGSTLRTCLLILGGLVVYLYKLGILKTQVQIVPNRQNNPQPAPQPAPVQQNLNQDVNNNNNNNVNNVQDPNPVNVERPEQQQQQVVVERTGLIREIENVIRPFVHSLLPSYNQDQVVPPAQLPPAIHPHQQ